MTTVPAALAPPTVDSPSRPDANRSGRRPRGPGRLPGWLRRPLVAVLAVVVLAGLWELYKAVGADAGWSLGETRILPRTTDTAMPHTWDLVARLTEPVSGARGAPVLWLAVAPDPASDVGHPTIMAADRPRSRRRGRVQPLRRRREVLRRRRR